MTRVELTIAVSLVCVAVCAFALGLLVAGVGRGTTWIDRANGRDYERDALDKEAAR